MKKERFAVVLNECAGSRRVEVNEVGVVAGEGGRWKIYVENASHSTAPKSDMLCTVPSRQEALKYIGRFIQFYRENRKYLERTHDFVGRISIETVRRVVIEDSNGICARLDAEIKGAVQLLRAPLPDSPEPIPVPQFAELLVPVVSGSGLFEGRRQRV
jgi:nitrite reductase (NADH) large subunit